MAQVYPCEQCGKIIKTDEDYVNVGIRLNPPGSKRVCGELLISWENQQFATHTVQPPTLPAIHVTIRALSRLASS